MLKQTVLSDPFFDDLFQPKTEKLSEINKVYSGTVIEKTVTELDMMTDLEWISVLYQNQTEIGTEMEKDLTTFLGVEKVSITDLFSVLADHTKTNWYDPFYTMSTYLRILATNIDSTYDSDVQLIRDLSETDGFEQERLETVYSELRRNKEKTGTVIQGENSIGKLTMFDSLFARFCFNRSLVIDNVLDPFVWKSIEPVTGEYVILHLVDSEGDPEPVVAKVVDSCISTVELSSIIPTLDSDRCSIEVEQKHINVNVISYDTSVIDMYPSLDLGTPSSPTMLTAHIEDLIEVRKENPLPL